MIFLGRGLKNHFATLQRERLRKNDFLIPVPEKLFSDALTCGFHNLPTFFGEFGISSCARVFSPVIYVLAARQCRCHVARSSSGLGRRPLKAEITSSNLVRATTSFLLSLMARSSSGLGRRPLKAEITSSNLVRATKHLIPELPLRFGFFIAAILDRLQTRPLFFLLQYMLYVLLVRLAGTIGKIYLN